MGPNSCNSLTDEKDDYHCLLLRSLHADYE